MVVEDAYTACLELAAKHYENFPVASRLLPKASRPYIAAIYAFARTADDFADEGSHTPAERISLLEQWQWRLREATAGRIHADAGHSEAVFTALADTIRRFNLDINLFEDLLSAFSQDVVVHRYDTWSDLLDYCRRSANPVGRLVLRVSGYPAGPLDRQSDAICTALQLVNFWQDLAVDWDRGRVYLPRDIAATTGADEAALTARSWPAEWQSAVREAASRTRRLFDEGRPMINQVKGRLGYELRATWLGGVRILDRLDATDFNVFERRPKLGWSDLPVLGWHFLRWPG